MARKLLAALLASAMALPAAAADMTYERAVNADKEPGNWLLHHKDYQGHRYSTLDQINAGNVKSLHLVFAVALGGLEGGGRYVNGNLEATPLVEDGMMYVSDGWGSVYKIDVSGGTRGTIVWKMDPQTDRAWAAAVACCGVNNRGVALWKDEVISVTLDGRLIGTQKDTGQKLWERKVADPAIAEGITMAPMVIRDLALVGTTGGEFGVRGWIDATDLNTHKQAWRTFTIPAQGEKGAETWKGVPDPARHGGGPVWETGTYDPQADVVYFGTGNPGPDWDAEARPGDNLWTDSVLALDPKTGAIKWGYQYLPNDPFDYDEISEHPLIDATIAGKPRKLVVHVARNGFFYELDRTNGEFVQGKQYVDQLNWTTGLDPETGKPLNYDPKKDVQPYAEASRHDREKPHGVVCPSTFGGKNWEPASYNPDLHLIYTAQLEACDGVDTKPSPTFIDQGGTAAWRDRYAGGSFAEFPAGPAQGSLKAIDVLTGEVKARFPTPVPNYGGTLATAGGLVFMGQPDGTVSAHDARTLQELWSINLGTGINAPPITYAVGGKQYVAILVGGKSSPVLATHPELKKLETASMLVVFGL